MLGRISLSDVSFRASLGRLCSHSHGDDTRGEGYTHGTLATTPFVSLHVPSPRLTSNRVAHLRLQASALQ